LLDIYIFDEVLVPTTFRMYFSVQASIFLPDYSFIFAIGQFPFDQKVFSLFSCHGGLLANLNVLLIVAPGADFFPT
jgi:hypothetical protein